MKKQLIIDAHLDLAMNAMEWNRDLTQPLQDIRERERHLQDKPDRGHGTVCFDELRNGGISLVVATQIARYVAPGNPLPGWHSPEQAWAQTQGQLAWYRAMEEQGQLSLVRDLRSLDIHLSYLGNDDTHSSIGYIVSLEGADSLVEPDYIFQAYENGLRAIGPAHYGEGRYANGTDSSGKLHPLGIELLKL
ncbi:MAG TPA: membrane dipeptidase, partial [Chitinophagaceae bacterium]